MSQSEGSAGIHRIMLKSSLRRRVWPPLEDCLGRGLTILVPVMDGEQDKGLWCHFCLPWGAIDQGLSYNGIWRGNSQHMEPTCGRMRIGSRLWVIQNCVFYLRVIETSVSAPLWWLKSPEISTRNDWTILGSNFLSGHPPGMKARSRAREWPHRYESWSLGGHLVDPPWWIGSREQRIPQKREMGTRAPRILVLEPTQISLPLQLSPGTWGNFENVWGRYSKM